MRCAPAITVIASAIEDSETDLTAWFLENVIPGARAFVETAARVDDHPAAIRRKLLCVITRATVSGPARKRVRAAAASP